MSGEEYGDAKWACSPPDLHGKKKKNSKIKKLVYPPPQITAFNSSDCPPEEAPFPHPSYSLNREQFIYLTQMSLVATALGS